ncbi:MAG: hypothetical protein EON93_14670, partial [Burkholderiales bacterium]
MTILKLTPAATSDYVLAHPASKQPSPSDRLLIAEALFARREFERCLTELRQHLVETPDDLLAVALLLQAGGALRPTEKAKRAAQVAQAIDEIRNTGTLSEVMA